MSIGEISPITILKIDYRTEDLPMILKSLLTLTSSIFGGLGFQYSCEWYIGLVELLKRNYTKKVFLVIFRVFQTSPEKYMTCSRTFSELFQNTQRKHFSCTLFLLKSEIIDWRPLTLDKKGKRVLFEYRFLCDHF